MATVVCETRGMGLASSPTPDPAVDPDVAPPTIETMVVPDLL